MIIIFISLAILILLIILFNITKQKKSIKGNVLFIILKKIILAILTLFIIITIIFILTELLPIRYFDNTSTDTSLSSDNRNILRRLLSYFYNILPIPKKLCASTHLQGNKFVCSSYKYSLINLGTSTVYMKNVPVTSIIKEQCLVSFSFGLIAYILQTLIGYPLGIYLAKKENSSIDKLYNTLHLIVKITPLILYFYGFVILFMVVFKLPVLFEIDNPITYIAPLSALTICSSLSIAYFIRKYILIEMNKDYVKFAISKGLDKNTILYKHVLRNASIPFIRTIPASILMCFSGFYILEASFNIPGIGLTFIHAIQLKDVDLIRGLIIFFACLSIIAHLLGDLLTIIFKKKNDFLEEDFKDERI